MLKRKVPAALAALCFLLAGCVAPAQPTPTPTAEPTPVAEVTTTPEPTPTPEEPLPPVRSEECFSSDGSIWGTRHYAAEYEDEYGPCFDIGMTLPWTTVEGEGYAAINKRFEELMAKYRDIRIYGGTLPEDRPLANPFLHLHLDLVRQTPIEVGRLVTFRLQRIDYSGGAHGDCFAWPETYDVTTGEQLGFEDYFSDTQEAEARILAEVWRQVESDQDTYWWLFQEGKSTPPESLLTEYFNRSLVYPVEDGFEVFYQWYTLGGHAFGAPTFLIPWEVLEGVTDTSVFGTAPELEESFLQAKGTFYGQEGQPVYAYDISLPLLYQGPHSYESVNRYYQQWMEELTAAVEESAAGNLSAVEELDLSAYLPAYLSIHAEPTFCNGDGLLQICGTRESYGLGAAHPLNSSFSHTFDRFTGEQIELPNLFSDWDKAKEILWAAIEPQAREALAFPDLSEEMLADRVGLAKELLDQNPVFFLGTEGLTVHYNEYAIASYAEGAFDFFVPKELWESLIYPEYLPILNAYS